ncbi:MAG TPA: hypothetical protein VMS43_04285 [Allosphingosinicella sp.]|nr:hypothetical protein [Allosphingosinicella sp.]
MVQLYKRKGDDILVNTATIGNQSGSNIALLPGGGFVIVWTDASLVGGDTSGLAVKGQRFDADGHKVGGEFLVNSTVTGSQTNPIVAALASGRFVVTWSDGSVTGGDTSSIAVRGQIFEANGTPVGAEFLINTQTANAQTGPGIVELAGGGFVVSWTDSSLIGGDASGSGIKAQIFDAAGAKVGGEILVNTETSGSQTTSSLIALASGGFAAAWTGAITASGGGVFGSVRVQLFDAAGAKLGTEQIVNANNEGNFNSTMISALGSGFIVTWAQQDSVFGVGIPVTFDVHAQLFDAAGAKVGGEFVVNTTTQGSQSGADVDALPGGGFLVTWQGPGTGTSLFNIFGQVFDNAGAKVGAEFVVTSVTSGNQLGPRVDVLPSGDIVIVWTDNNTTGPDQSGSAIKMQILTLTTDAPTDIGLSSTSISETAREDVPLVKLSATGALNSTFTYVIVSDSTGGAFAIEGDSLVVADNSLLDFEGDAQVEVRIRVTDLNGNSYEETIQLDIADTPEGGYAAPAGEILLNTTTAGDQVEPIVTALSSGGFLATWKTVPTSGLLLTTGQIFDAAGVKVGGELSLSDTYSVAGLPGGGFITAGEGTDADGGGVFVQFHDAAGAPVGVPIPVNTQTAGNQYEPSITMLASGGFVVTWTHFTISTFTSVVQAQIFDAAGVKVGAELQVPSITSGGGAEVVALADGGFVVSWTDGSVQAQIYTALGGRYGPQITVAEFPNVEPHITALADGGFVVTYARNISSGGFTGIDRLTAQIFDAEGNRVGDPILISVDGPAQVASTSVAALPWGGFVVSWADFGDAPGNPDSDVGIRAQVFDATGATVGGQQVVNIEGAFYQIQSSVTVLESGDFVIAWYDSSQVGGDASGSGIKARIFSVEEVSGPTEGPDFLNGTSGSDVIDALGGNDVVNGLGGNDILLGGSGDDELNGGEGNDTLYGEGGADIARGGAGDDVYIVDSMADVTEEAAGAGNDTIVTTLSYILSSNQEIETLTTQAHAGTDDVFLTGNQYNNTLIGNAGDNIMNGVDGADVMYGLDGDDTYAIDNVGDLVVDGFGQGNDLVLTYLSHTLSNGNQIETLSTVFHQGTTAINLGGNDYDNTLIGNYGANYLNGNGGIDVMIGLYGDDTYVADNAGDVVQEVAGGGADLLYSFVSYTLAAGQEVEIISTAVQGGSTAINLTGNEFAQTIVGNAGANLIDGKGGNDVLYGLGGTDTFAFTTTLGAGNVDTLADFVAGTDKIGLDDAIFTAIGATLNASAFVIGTAAGDADDRIVYNSTTGALFYDADGSGAGAAVQFATLSPGLVLTAGDFTMI